MDPRYVYKNGKHLRTGYTTGSCAAAVAKAATWMLFHQEPLAKIEIDTPKGWKLELDLQDVKVTAEYAQCCVIKDSGDDPDITDGMPVYGAAEKSLSEGMEVIAGEGIGMVTIPGLSVSVGKPAINPIPMKMIHEEVDQVLPGGSGVQIKLWLPKGEELARKTFNPKLGIVEGLSILGTTGIVEPMSQEAIKDTIALELQCYREKEKDFVVLVPGNYGEQFCREHFGILKDRIIKISNYLGFALEKCAELGFRKVLLAGHIGKMIKPAGGIFYTHSRVSKTRLEIITAYLGVLGMKQADLIRVMDCKTTEEALPIIKETGFEAVYDLLVNRCEQNCEAYIYDQIQIGAVFFSMKDVLAISENAKGFLEESNDV